MNRPTNKKAGFTLVEIMIVVLIIGILLAIAIPNFVSARESSRAKACVGNLKQIDSAKQQCAMDNKLSGTSTATFDITGTAVVAPAYQLVGSSGYIRATPVCPSGAAYFLGGVAIAPGCATSYSAAGTPLTVADYGAPGTPPVPGKFFHGLAN